MRKYIFFRTDRIGDFLMSSILFKSIKKSDPNSKIILIASKKNYDYINNIDFVDEVILFPKNFYKKIFFYSNFFFKKFFLIGVLDGKKRSIYFSLFVRSKYKFLFTYKNFYYSIMSLFYTKVYLDKNCLNKISEIKDLLNIINLNFDKDNLNTINKEIVSRRNLTLVNSNNYILLHFDEKWIFKDYIQTYNSIEPLNEQNLFIFLKKILEKSNSDLVITTGFKKNKFINFLKNKFNVISENIFVHNVNNKKIYLYDNLSFLELEKLILFCDTLITCHGAPSHVAAAFNKKIIDIIDFSENDFFLKWTAHFRNHKLINRENFEQTSYKILNLL
tara:strand:+ start:465 stop:1460 length:996 start_codon:yes stop_codon:yes gene_type:complete